MTGRLKQFTEAVSNRMGFARHRCDDFLGLKRLPIRSVIDVGANQGQFARKISSVFPEAQIYCFEPLPEPFDKLRHWSDRRQGAVTVFNVALGDREGAAEMFIHAEHSPSSSLLRSTAACETLYPFTRNQATVSVSMTTLDRIFGHPPPLRPDTLIKLDVQGFEDRVISGGPQTFRNARACLVEVSLDVLYEKQAAFKGIVLLLDNLGYRYAGNTEQICAEDGHVIYLDALFVK
jgi:FkbM family methyltransferase